MKFRILFTIVLCLFVVQISSAQQNNDEYIVVKKKKMTKRRKNKAAMVKIIRQLKNGGAILYMVRDKKINTAMLQEKGLPNAAKEMEQRQIRKNKIIVKGLKTNFKFCPIYFFLQSDLEFIQQGKISENLVDTALLKSNEKFHHSFFLIMDYGDLYSEEGKIYNDSLSFDKTGLPSLKEHTFVLKNKYLSQLVNPFPYYFTVHYPAKDLGQRTEKYVLKLQKFYRKNAE